MIHNLWFRKYILKDTNDEGIFQCQEVSALSCTEISQVCGDCPSPRYDVGSHDPNPNPDGQGLTSIRTPSLSPIRTSTLTPILTLGLRSQQIGFINSTKWVKFEYWL